MTRGARRLRLPLSDAASDVPTVDAVRAKLGGRAPAATHDPLLGAVVHVERRDDRPAVVLHLDRDDAHLWVSEGLVLRVRRTAISPYEGGAAAPVLKVASDVRTFSSLVEGERVAFLTQTGAVAEGTLVERCRYGALVVRADGVVVGVGFRRIWRATRPVD